MKKIIVILFYLLIISISAKAATVSFSGERVKGQVIIPYEKVSLNSTLSLGAEFRVERDWHIYWINPGDSGAEPKITAESLSPDQDPGFSIQKIFWPAPKRIPLKDLTNFGYEGTVILPFDIKITKEQKNYPIKIEWLVCKVECIPGFAEIKLPFQFDSNSITKFNSTLEKLTNALNELPQAISQPLKYKMQNTSMTFHIPLHLFASADLANIQKNLNTLDAFFTAPAVFHNHRKPQFTVSNNELLAELQLDENFDFSNFKGFNPTDELVLKVSNKAFAFTLTMQKIESNSSASIKNSATNFSHGSDDSEKISFITSLLFAFLGGIILNLMPCVFPVLSIKILSFVDEKPHQLKISGWMYTLGVLTSFAALAFALLTLRAFGESYGWGFQMQNPIFVSLMAILFFFIGLNFYGYFEFGDSFAQASQVMNGQKNKLAAFVTGVLAVIVATPCTAPFMGSALGASLFLPPYLSFFIFIALGMGLAFPFLLLSYAPHLLKKLPRPGRWMEILKQFFAFPMFLTTLWLLWILEQQTSFDIIIGFLSLCLGFILLIWWPWKKPKSNIRVIIALVLMFLFLKQVYNEMSLSETTGTTSNQSQSLWQNYSPEKIEAALNSGKPVFIDFTAKWCITCQVNKRTVLRTEKIEALFKNNNVELFSADWTKQDPIITKALEAFGRRSVPLYVYYPANDKSKPILLPELLTHEMIEQLFTKK